MRLLTPARYDALPGLPFPVPPDAYPHKDDVADYLQLYAKHFELPIELNTRVSRLDHDRDRFVLHTKNDALRAARVVVATGPFTCSYVSAFAAELDPSVVQLRSGAYRSPGQIPPGLAAAVSHKFLAQKDRGDRIIAGRLVWRCLSAPRCRCCALRSARDPSRHRTRR
jgi:putative flavoprotein involved in K+ transport